MKQYLQGEWVNDLAQLMRLGIKGGGTVKEATTAKHHPARLQLFISTVHKTPEQTQSVHFTARYSELFEHFSFSPLHFVIDAAEFHVQY